SLSKRTGHQFSIRVQAFQRKGFVPLRVPDGRVPFAARALMIEEYPLGFAAALRIDKSEVGLALVIRRDQNYIRDAVALQGKLAQGCRPVLVSPVKDDLGVVAFQGFQSLFLGGEKIADVFGRDGKVQTFRARGAEGIDADYFSVKGEKRPPRVAGINRRLSLDDRSAVLIVGTCRPFVVGSNLTDDSLGEGPSLTFRMANSGDVGADLEIR